jgi:hypothetical protein
MKRKLENMRKWWKIRDCTKKTYFGKKNHFFQKKMPDQISSPKKDPKGFFQQNGPQKVFFSDIFCRKQDKKTLSQDKKRPQKYIKIFISLPIFLSFFLIFLIFNHHQIPCWPHELLPLPHYRFLHPRLRRELLTRSPFGDPSKSSRIPH